MKKINLFFVFFIVFCFYSKAQTADDSLLNFIATHKSNSSIYLLQNDTLVAHLNENKMMPLASTVKIFVAIEFAKQVAKQIISEADMVALTDLEKYYLPNTDGNAHPNWITYEKKLGHLINDSVQLLDVARGMIMFSSNANTEFLMEVLGIDNIKNNIALLGIKNHTAIFPLVASLFMYQNPKNKNEDKVLKGINRLSDEQYCRFIYDMHKALTFDTLLKSKFRPQDLSMKMQKMWSDKLPSSTTKEYVRICTILNNRAFFDEDTYAVLSSVLETLTENPANKKWLKHAGTKGGSTAWVLTKALYATTQQGNKIEIAYFFNNLTLQQNNMLQGWMNSFEIALLSDNNFRKKVALQVN
ncbi:MAG: serine hydrolase [Ferruginibacter sp.]|nr:D-alanyl-D-alanine carboxypeptidase [Ferruginibacter sp.]